MSIKTIKYSILIALALIIIYLILPLGDYCWGLAHGLGMVLLIGIFLIFSLIFLVLEIIADYRNQRKFDYNFLAIPLISLFLIIYIFNISGEKFWTKLTLIGQIEIEDSREAEFKLYKNNSFSARISFVDFSCTFQGTYQVNDEVLILQREDFAIITDSLFTTEYKFEDSLLIPKNPEFRSIKIKN